MKFSAMFRWEGKTAEVMTQVSGLSENFNKGGRRGRRSQWLASELVKQNHFSIP
ncbi:hypothetical protein J4434_06800 [Candidatus Woesearchaeota archaeon]|nr:hypothetical protein [Candidatus Woesearchaeota archaeon]